MIQYLGMATWQNTKHKGPTLEEIQEAKEEEMRRKQEKEEEALKEIGFFILNFLS